jgi:hypothetical protein
LPLLIILAVFERTVVMSRRATSEAPQSSRHALNLLLSEQKVQRAPLRGYWKLNGEVALPELMPKM